MRTVRFSLSAAAASAPPPLMKEAGNVAGVAAAAEKPRRAFAPLRIHPWQRGCLEASRDQLLPQTLLYHGTHLGPRPLIILDHTTKSPAEAAAAAQKYEAVLSQLSWEYGAVYIPLQVDYSETTKGLIEHTCQQVCAVMDVLDVRWTHFLTHSYGCLVAAYMAASEAFPHRIGTFISLDTPLVTRALVQNMQQREEIAKAERNVNVPEADLSFAKHSLLSSLEGPLPCPAESDTGLYNDYLFNPAGIFHADGLVRCEERYVPVKHLAEVRHPMQLVVPAGNTVADVAVHKEFFGLRRPVVLKGCQCHEELFHDEGAKELAKVLETWLQRFEPDAYLAKRYEQAAREMSQLMMSSVPASVKADGAEGGGEQRKKKKEKKKKA
ncbi:hypothetical protein TraAM80_07744 [Trypanosoma rangeli]|uniref:AB hydrolase-1 domain-containing protein n=1 Tax=Trypanosoma rangeli TaxID=5698 RepID=A0A422N4J3_TRYRA|nr:uncharacterized protein TraAM80_07744 [Trypanosoma rangeli]RNF00397.1 hypothetical protein TraAM80_07744 [Trypanosoma rangeli]|eukprot:RNF00397.1 hypothetical protein TraAM80_07744 [Trypanosoma rangeli]